MSKFSQNRFFVKIFFLIILGNLVWVLLNIYISRYQVNWIVQSIPLKVIKSQWNKYKTSKTTVYMEKSPEIYQKDIIIKLKKLSINKKNLVLLDRQYFIYYYSNLPGIYYSPNSLFMTNGLEPLPYVAKKLNKKYNLYYALTTINYLKEKNVLNIILLNQAKLIYNNGYYLIFRINNDKK